MQLGYYDKAGRPLALMEWARLFEDRAYKVVKQETLPNGKFVSTVWLGLDHRFTGTGPPLIFETMVFPQEGNWADQEGNWTDEECRRYSTLDDALAGHAEMVREQLALIGPDARSI